MIFSLVKTLVQIANAPLMAEVNSVSYLTLDKLL